MDQRIQKPNECEMNIGEMIPILAENLFLDGVYCIVCYIVHDIDSVIEWGRVETLKRTLFKENDNQALESPDSTHVQMTTMD